MKKNLLLFSLLVSGAASAQITITQADVTAASTVVYQVNDTTPTVSVGSAGASQTWNMSALATSFTDTIHFEALSNVPDDTTFAASNLVLQFGSAPQWGYAVKSATSLSVLGNTAHFDPGTGNDEYLIQRNAPAEKIISFPTTYNTMFANNYISDAKFYYGADPGGFGFNIDSVWLKSMVSKSNVADAWGYMTTPLGSFSVLRLKETKYQLDSTFGYVTGIGWIFFQEATDTSMSYTWWANGVGFPLVQADMDMSTGTPSVVKWIPVIPEAIAENHLEELNVYPNPASAYVSFDNLQDADLISVYDMSGKLVLSKQATTGTFRMDVSSLSAGTYTFTVATKKVLSKQGRFNVVK